MNLNDYLMYTRQQFEAIPADRLVQETKDYRRIMSLEAGLVIGLGALEALTSAPFMKLIEAIPLFVLGADYLSRLRGSYGERPVSGILGFVNSYRARRNANTTGAGPTATGTGH